MLSLPGQRRGNDQHRMSMRDFCGKICNPSRRAFCIHACQTVSCLALGSIAQGCGGGGSAPSNVPQLSIMNATVSGGTVVVQVDSASPLATVGGAAQVRSSGACPGGPHRAGHLHRLTATCTHEACTIPASTARLICPCLVRASIRGPRLNGPATTACARSGRCSRIICDDHLMTIRSRCL